jgi:COMPASS component SWD3
VRYRAAVSRDVSPYQDESDEDNRRTYWRDRSPPRRARRRSRRRDSSDSTARSTSTHSSVEASSPESRPYSPGPAPQPKALRFNPLLTIAKAHARGITCLKFSPDGSLLATSSADATINIYAVSTSESPATLTHVKTLTGHLAGINALSWSPSGPPYTLASASDDKSILLWSPSSTASSPSTPLAPSPLLGHHNYVTTLAFSAKGNMLVSGSYDEAVLLWDVRAGRVMRSLPAHSDPVGGVDFLRDGTMVVSCAGDGLVRIWDAGTGQCLKTLVDEDRKPVMSVRFTPNGKFVLAWTLDGCVRLWDYVGGTCVKTYQGHVNREYGLGGCVGTYMPEQREAFVASGSEDGDVVAWDVTSKEILWRGKGHRKPVLAVDFLRGEDGRGILVSGGLDRDIRAWVEVRDVDEAELQDGDRELRPQTDGVASPTDAATAPKQREGSEVED